MGINDKGRRKLSPPPPLHFDTWIPQPFRTTYSSEEEGNKTGFRPHLPNEAEEG